MKAQLCSADVLSDYPIESEYHEQSFSLLRHGDFFSIGNGDSKLALLNKKKSSDMCALTESHQVQLRAFTSTNHFIETIQFWKENSWGTSGRSLTIEINVYGSERDAKAVGILLGKSKCYLQPPRYGLGAMRYRNPQILPIPGFTDQTHIPPFFMPEDDGDNSSHNDDEMPVQEDEIDDVEEILDSKLRHVLRTNISVDRRIRSELHP